MLSGIKGTFVSRSPVAQGATAMAVDSWCLKGMGQTFAMAFAIHCTGIVQLIKNSAGVRTKPTMSDTGDGVGLPASADVATNQYSCSHHSPVDLTNFFHSSWID